MACVRAKKFDDVWSDDLSTVSSATRRPPSETSSSTEVPKSTYASEQPCQSDRASETKSPSSECVSESEGPNCWTILWVHEHCHKPTNAVWKHELESTAKGFGAKPTCLKKPVKFYQFMDDNNPQNYVLLTDWREARKCIKFASQSRLHQPLLTVVLCESDKQYGKVLRWAEGTNEKDVGPISVVMKPESPTQLLSDVVATLLHRGGVPLQVYLGEPSEGLATPAPPESPVPSGRPGQAEVDYDNPAAAAIPGLAQEDPVEVHPQGGCERLAEPSQAAIGLPAPAMAAMLSIWDSCGSRANIERLLHEAVPACYED